MMAPPLRFARAADGVKVCYALLPGHGAPFLFAQSPGPAPLPHRLQVRSYAQYCDRFRRGSPMVTYDNRGYGGSDPGHGEASLDQCGLDLAAVVDALGQPVHLIGNYGFASLISGFAADHPELVLSVTLASPRLRGIFGKPDVKSLLDTNFELAQLYILRMAYDWIEGQRAEDFLDATVAGKRDGYLWERASRSLADTRLADFLPRVTVPVHVVANDVGEDRADAILTAAMLPHARLTFVSAGPLNGERGAMLRDVFDSFWTSVAEEGQRLPPAPAAAGSGSNGLSPRELEVLALLAAGKPNRQIAEALVLSEATVATHVRHILEKTGSANRVEAAGWARDNGAARVTIPVHILSPRETDVLRLVAAGHTNAEVAADLILSIRTVERHLENVCQKTGCSNRAAAVAWAIRGWCRRLTRGAYWRHGYAADPVHACN